MVTLLVLAPFASAIPLASMAPILMIVAWNISERKHFAHLIKMRTGDSMVLLITFLLTVFTSLTTAVEVGLILAVILFTKQMSGILVTAKVLPDHNSEQEKVMPHVVNDHHDCPQVSIFTIEGPLFFGAAQTFENRIMETIHLKPKVLILRLGKYRLWTQPVKATSGILFTIFTALVEPINFWNITEIKRNSTKKWFIRGNWRKSFLRTYG